MQNYTPVSDKSEDKKVRFDKYIFGVAMLICFHLIVNILWIKINQNPLDYDPIGHTFATINSAEYIKNSFANFSLKDYMKISPGYPNFVETATLPLVFIFGNHWKVIQFSGTLFFLLAILATFLYVKEISQRSKIAFYSAFFYSFFISIDQYSRLQMLDIPLTAMIFLTLYLWEKFKNTKNLRYWYFSCLTLGFAQTSKWHAGIFLFVPLIFLVISLYKDHFFQDKKLFHFLFGLLISLLLVFPWYYYNFVDFIRLGKINYLGEPDDPKSFFSLTTALYYLKQIAIFQTHFIGFILLIVSFFIIPFRKKKYLLASVITVVFCYLFFSFLVPNKNIRVIFPLMPFFGLIMAEGLEQLKYWWGKILSWGVTFYVVIAFFILSFGFPWQPNFRYVVKLPLFEYVDLIYLNTYPINLLPSRQRINFEKIIDDIILLQNNRPQPLKVLVAVHQPYFHDGILALEIYMREQNDLEKAYEILNDKLKIISADNLLKNNGLINGYLNDFDIILTTEKNPIHLEEVLNPIYSPIKATQSYLFSSENESFIQSSSFSLPNNDKLSLFYNRRLLK
ncbi:MAG: glycosyltransferase family 39 protein [Patescibacteria group bacterium]